MDLLLVGFYLLCSELPLSWIWYITKSTVQCCVVKSSWSVEIIWLVLPWPRKEQSTWAGLSVPCKAVPAQTGSRGSLPAPIWNCFWCCGSVFPLWFTMRVLDWTRIHNSFWKADSEFLVTTIRQKQTGLVIFCFLSKGIAVLFVFSLSSQGTLLEIFLLFYFWVVLTFKFITQSISQNSADDSTVWRTVLEKSALKFWHKIILCLNIIWVFVYSNFSFKGGIFT